MFSFTRYFNFHFKSNRVFLNFPIISKMTIKIIKLSIKKNSYAQTNSSNRP